MKNAELTTMQHFAAAVRALRKEKGISQEELAEAIGTTRVTLAKYEAGKHSANIDVLARAARYFGVSADFLLGLSPMTDTMLHLMEARANAEAAEKAMEPLGISIEQMLTNCLEAAETLKAAMAEMQENKT